MEEEKAVDMPASGPARPDLSWSKTALMSPPPTLMALDHVGHRAHRLQQAPEGAEQAEEDHQRRSVAGQLAAFVQPGCRCRRAGCAWPARIGVTRPSRPAASARGSQHARHGRQQLRRYQAGEALAGALVVADPGDLGLQPQDLPQVPDDAEQKDEEDKGVERRIAGEEDAQLGDQEDRDGEHRPPGR